MATFDITHLFHHTLARITLAHMPPRPSVLMDPANDTHSDDAA